MLATLGIAPDAFRGVVATAESDDDVAAYVVEHAVADGAHTWNTFLLNREIYDGDRAEAIADHPFLADHPELKLSIDLLHYIEAHGLDAG